MKGSFVLKINVYKYADTTALSILLHSCFFASVLVQFGHSVWALKPVHRHQKPGYAIVLFSIFRRGTHLYISLFPSVRPSVRDHISGTVYHVIIIFGSHV